ncbi:MAG: family 43 glycosylhydrolase [Clostridia bacterium]|nr:family 43 glycosylhydrolase [Clostridia bacterium]
MKNSEINIRDPFVLVKDGIYYLYGTRAANFGRTTAGFDVYKSTDLENWSEPVQCFNSEKAGLNREVNWAPEVHEYMGRYYMFATFTKENGLRGTYILSSDSPDGPFTPHSDGAVTPPDWECLDGTFYVEDGKPYIVFCHEHTQIIDGTICYMPLTDDLKAAAGEPVKLFAASEPYYVVKKQDGDHYVTDGPFMFRSKTGELFMIWSTFPKGLYAECVVKFEGGSIKNRFEHLAPLIDDDGGHGMIFKADDKLYLTFHSPNKSGSEHPFFVEIEDCGDNLKVK